MSGMTYEIHIYIKSSCTKDKNGLFTGVADEYRVKNVKVGGKPLDLNKKYTVAANDYSLNNGDGFTMFEGSNILKKSVKIDNQVLIDYIVDELGGKIGEEYLDLYGQGRIVIINEPTGVSK